MYVRVLPFGILKDWLGASATTMELPDGASVGDLLDLVGALRNATPALRSIAVSVNAEYVNASHLLSDGDEVGLLPPVSGGSDPRPGDSQATPVVIALTREVIDTENLVAAAKHGEDGAVVVFDGIVRNNTRGRRTLHLDYEAYEEMALKQMNELAEQALSKYAVRHVTIIHRGAAFDACRWVIDTLKQTVPIWKKETFVDGVVWAPGEPFPAALSVAPEATREP